MKKILTLFLLFGTYNLIAQAPKDYYNATECSSGEELKNILHEIIKTHRKLRYTPDIWKAFRGTDLDSNGKVWGMYNDCEFIYKEQQQGSRFPKGECEKYNREHTLPKSYWGGATSHDAFTDLFHIIPADSKWNAWRSNDPYGIVDKKVWKTSNNGSKSGYTNTTIPGYHGKVFEPADQYKGDLARIYFYMATRYQDEIASWEESNEASNAVLDGSSYLVFEPWMLEMLLMWHKNDPVSQKEINRNESIYRIQGNRNPYIDHPEWVQCVWYSNTELPIIDTNMYEGPSILELIKNVFRNLSSKSNKIGK